MASSHGGKTMWCVPEISSEFIDRMEDVLRLYARKFDHDEPYSVGSLDLDAGDELSSQRGAL